MVLYLCKYFLFYMLLGMRSESCLIRIAVEAVAFNWRMHVIEGITFNQSGCIIPKKWSICHITVSSICIEIYTLHVYWSRNIIAWNKLSQQKVNLEKLRIILKRTICFIHLTKLLIDTWEINMVIIYIDLKPKNIKSNNFFYWLQLNIKPLKIQ